MSTTKTMHIGISLLLILILSIGMIPAAWAEGAESSDAAGVVDKADTENVKGAETPTEPVLEAPVQEETDAGTAQKGPEVAEVADAAESTEAEESSVEAESVTASPLDLKTAAHVQDIGWQEPVSQGEIAGTTGSRLRMEALKMELSDSTAGSVSYSVYVADTGWTDGLNGEVAGTTGACLAIEALKVQLDGDAVDEYDVYYRTHVAEIGWLDWACNGEKAGSAGYGHAIEAVQVELVKKGEAAPGPTGNPYQILGSLAYSAHVQDIGWQNAVADGATAGTTGRLLRVEALSIEMPSSDLSGDVEYEAHVQDIGWQGERKNGAIAGTAGMCLRTEALKINLTGQKEQTYDIYYRVHVQNYGWLDWACNGQEAGTTGLCFRIEAVEIKLVDKGGAAPGPTARHSVSKATTSCSAHVQDIGWQAEVGDEGIFGTTGRSLRLEAMKMNLQSAIPGGISYSAHVRDIGWQGWVSDGEIAGTTGRGLQSEAVKIQLTGDAAYYYDVYYRVHAQEYGWMGWAKNGEAAGTTTIGYRLEAIQVVLVGKGGAAPGPTTNAYTEKPVMPPVISRMLSIAQQYSSPSQYLLMVDTDDTKTCVFEGSRGNWRLKYAWDCGSGAPETPTILGVFSVGIKGYSFGEQWGYSCYYYTQFCGDYLFHTGLYYANTWNPMDIGMNIRNSHGCVRLDPPNAKWIWDNVPQGTTVVTIV